VWVRQLNDAMIESIAGSGGRLLAHATLTIDTTVVATQLILTGVLERFPRLRLVLVHGGGFLPYQTGRLDREFGSQEGKLPSDHVKAFYYDTVFMSAPALELLFSLVGTGQVMIGSDYAAGPVERAAGRLTDALDATRIDASARRAIVRDTAENLFRTAAGPVSANREEGQGMPK
jgi:predicted TIM-barrel fold metal-dependent hydrolase